MSLPERSTTLWFATWFAIERRSAELLSATLALGIDPNAPYAHGELAGWGSPLSHVLQRQWNPGVTVILGAIAAKISE